MPAKFRSIVGRDLGITSTRGLGQYVGSSGEGSTALDMMFQQWGNSLTITTTSTAAVTLSNSGISIINTSATAATYLIAAPVIGVKKEVWIVSAASAITFGGTSTSQVFMRHGGGVAGSTTATLVAASLAGVGIKLTGLSATQWGIELGSTVIQG